MTERYIEIKLSTSLVNRLAYLTGGRVKLISSRVCNIGMSILPGLSTVMTLPKTQTSINNIQLNY